MKHTAWRIFPYVTVTAFAMVCTEADASPTAFELWIAFLLFGLCRMIARNVRETL